MRSGLISVYGYKYIDRATSGKRKTIGKYSEVVIYMRTLIISGITSYRVEITPIDVFYYETKHADFSGGNNSVYVYEMHMNEFNGKYPKMDWEFYIVIGNIPTGGRSYFRVAESYNYINIYAK